MAGSEFFLFLDDNQRSGCHDIIGLSMLLRAHVQFEAQPLEHGAQALQRSQLSSLASTRDGDVSCQQDFLYNPYSCPPDASVDGTKAIYSYLDLVIYKRAVKLSQLLSGYMALVISP